MLVIFETFAYLTTLKDNYGTKCVKVRKTMRNTNISKFSPHHPFVGNHLSTPWFIDRDTRGVGPQETDTTQD